MLFIAAVNKMLDQIDDLFRIKLKLGPLDSLLIIERRLVTPLLTAEYESTESKTPPVAQAAAQEASDPVQADSGVVDYPLRFVKSNWLAFLQLSDADFKTSMRDNLSAIGLDTKKLLILFRLRKNIATATVASKKELEARDKLLDKPVSESKEEGKKTGKSSQAKSNPKPVEALPSIDFALLTYILEQIEEAISSVGLARGLSGTDLTGNITLHGGIGETEILIQKMQFVLKEHTNFCTEVDKQTAREVGNPYALRDMLPSVMLRDNFIIKCHLAMHEYILKNLNEYGQYSVDQKRSFSLKYMYTQACNQFYYPDVSIQKRTQVIEFLVTLAQKTRDTAESSTEYQNAVLSCIDTYLSMAHTTNQSNIGVLSINFNKSAPKLEVAYSELHESLISKQHKGDGFHKCHASKLLVRSK